MASQHRVRELEALEGDVAQEVLAEAFRDDPTLCHCFGGDEPGYEERLRGYLRVGHEWHVSLSQPVRALDADGRLAAVAYVMDPDIALTPESSRLLWQGLERACGAESTERFRRYNEAVEAVSPEGEHHGIALVAVRRTLQGQGLGSALIEDVSRRCDADPRSAGVVLDTGVDRNRILYRRHGYADVATARVDGLTEWVMCRPRRAS